MEVFFKHHSDSVKGYKAIDTHVRPLKTASNNRVLPITLDKHGRERIGFVKKSNFDSYLIYHQDPVFIQSLPDFHLPMLGAGSFRAFEIGDDSMHPIEIGSIVVGEYVQDWEKLPTGKTFTLLHKEYGLLFRRIYYQKNRSQLKLQAESKSYPPLLVKLNEISEIWQARMFISI
ncbi:MAG: hypothetical protein AAF696_04240 [Bacteroidota bacterium]